MLHLNAASVDRANSARTDVRFVSAGSLHARGSLARGRIARRLNRVASLRFSFLSACSNRARFRPKAASLRSIPLRRSIRPCGIVATCPRSSLTSSAFAIVDRDPIMRHRPLPRRRSAIDPDWLRPGHSIRRSFRRKGHCARMATLMGFSGPFAALILSHRVKPSHPRRFTPRVPFHERSPREILVRGIDRRILR